MLVWSFIKHITFRSKQHQTQEEKAEKIHKLPFYDQEL